MRKKISEEGGECQGWKGFSFKYDIQGGIYKQVIFEFKFEKEEGRNYEVEWME